LLAEAQTVGTLPPPIKGQTKMNAAMKTALEEVRAVVAVMIEKVCFVLCS
jgi:hypothetical protein